MVSALRQRAVTEAAAAAGAGAGAGTGDERVEPTLMPEGVQPPVVTDEVLPEAAPAPAWRRPLQAVLRGLQGLGALARRIPLQSVALVALGMGLALFGLGLVLYFRPAAPRPVEAPAAAVAPAPAVAPDKAVTSVTPEPGGHAAPDAPDAQEAPGPHGAAPADGPAAPASATPAEAASQAEAAASAAAPPASAPAAVPEAAKPEFLMDPAYGKDGNTNGVPDTLDRWLTRTLHSQVTQEAARQYYRTVLPLASKLHLGVALSRTEKLSALRAAECYLVTANEEGLRVPPNLNDRVLMLGEEPAVRMKELFKALQGVDFPLSGSRQQACGG